MDRTHTPQTGPELLSGGQAAAAQAVEALLSPGRTVLAAIDGRCGSGKSTLAAALGRRFGCPVVHMDDFYLPPQGRAPNWAGVPAGNMDLPRFLEQVLLPLRAGEAARYRPFCCATGALLDPVEVPPGPLIVVEGSYSHHPLLAEKYDLKLFLTCSRPEQLRRLEGREGERVSRFRQMWIPLEERYFSALQIPAHSDLVLDTDSWSFYSEEENVT